MKKNFLTVFTLTIAKSVHSQSLLGDISSTASSWQTNIHALKSVTLTDCFYILEQPGSKTVRIIAAFQNIVDMLIGQSYILIRTFPTSDVIRALLSVQCTTMQENQTIHTLPNLKSMMI